jgi:hypothetical protein
LLSIALLLSILMPVISATKAAELKMTALLVNAAFIFSPVN